MELNNQLTPIQVEYRAAHVQEIKNLTDKFRSKLSSSPTKHRKKESL